MAREVQDRVLNLITSTGARLEREGCPVWLRRPGRAECGALWPVVAGVYTAMTGSDLPDMMPPRERRSLDALWHHDDGTARIIEFDETQHFNLHRARTLDFYPASSAVAFDLETWRHRSRQVTKLRGGGWGAPKPPLFPAPGGRHLQRAFRDLLADLLPPANGLRPTLRIGHFEVEPWLDTPSAGEQMRLLLAGKLAGEA